MTEEVNRADEFISKDEDLLLSKYYSSNFQYQSLLNSYNHFVTHDLPLCINYPSIAMGPDTILKLNFVKFEPSKISHNQALLEKKTFSGNIMIRLQTLDAETKAIKKETAPFLLSPMVAMVYSIADKYPLTGPNDPRIEGDPGCYMIVNGIIRIVLLKEKLRHTQYRLTRAAKTGALQVKYLTDMPQGGVDGSTTQTVISIASDVDKTKRKDGPLISTMLNRTEVRTKNMQAFSVSIFEAIYLITYYMKRRGKDFEDEVAKSTIVENFETTLKEILPIKHLPDVFAALQTTRTTFLLSKMKDLRNRLKENLSYDGLTDREINTLAASYIARAIFPSFVDPDEKISMCTTMTARLLQCYTGKIPITNRNSWSFKGSFLPGTVLLHLFRRKLNSLIGKISDELSKEKIRDIEIIANQIQTKNTFNIESTFLAEFTNSPVAGKSGGSFGDKRVSEAPVIVTQDIYANNTNDIRIQLYKIKADVNKNVHGEEIRSNKPSSFRVTAKQAVTDNDLCGLLNFLALLSQFTVDSDPALIYRVLLKQKFKGETIAKSKRVEGKYTLPVFVNGLKIGFVNAENGYRTCVMLKRHGLIYRDCTIVPISAGVLDIYCDAHRTLRPTLVVDKETSRPRIYSKKYQDIWRTMHFHQLEQYGLIEYLDPYECENRDIRIAQTFMSFDHQENDLKQMEKDIRVAESSSDSVYLENLKTQYELMKKHRYSHADLSPIVGYGIAGALTVFPNHQQACRSAFEQKQIAQEITKLLDNPFTHTNMLRSVYGMNHLVDSGIAQLMGIKGEQGGYPLIIGFYSHKLNEEDAAIINRNVVDFGLMRYIDTMIFNHSVVESKNKKEKFGRFVAPDRHPSLYRYIQDNGMPVAGVYYGPKDCILGSYEIVTPEDANTSSYIRDTSRYLDEDEGGYVTEVVSFTNVKSAKTTHDVETSISVKIEKFANLERGDKVSTPYSQKHIVSMIWPDADMPFIYRLNKQMKLGMLVNAHCFTTRMTVGSLLEPLAAKAIVGSGRTYLASAHRKHNLSDLRAMLRSNGFRDDGVEEAYDGKTGERMEVGIFTGPSRVRQLIHLAKKKIQCRSIGNLTKTTRQAAASRKGIVKNKGNKFGEHERISALKGNAPFTVDERMNVSSDAFNVVICRCCNSYAYFDGKTSMFTCRVCGIEKKKEQNKAFGRYMYPYSSKYEEELLNSIGYGQRIRFVGKEEYLVEGKVRVRNFDDDDIGELDFIEEGEEDEQEEL